MSEQRSARVGCPKKNNGQAERGLYLPSNASIAEFINQSERDGFILITGLRYKRRKGIKGAT